MTKNKTSLQPSYTTVLKIVLSIYSRLYCTGLQIHNSKHKKTIPSANKSTKMLAKLNTIDFVRGDSYELAQTDNPINQEDAKLTLQKAGIRQMSPITAGAREMQIWTAVPNHETGDNEEEELKYYTEHTNETESKIDMLVKRCNVTVMIVDETKEMTATIVTESIKISVKGKILDVVQVK